MKKLTSKDVEILDPILEKLVKTGRVHSDHLEPMQKHLFSKFGEVKLSEYRPYLHLLTEYGAGRVHELSGKFIIDSIPVRAKEIYDNGGFKAIFNKQHTEEIRQTQSSDLEFSKLQYEEKLARWQVKSFWYLFAFAAVGSVFGIISFFMQIF